jgi:hypothetical protein
MFSFGQKVACKVEIYRKDETHFQRNFAKVVYSATSDGRRVSI